MGQIPHGMITEAAVCIIDKLQAAGFDAYLVGGAVRDLLLGRTPKDYDIATDARPNQVKKVFGRSARVIGRRFRLVHVRSGHDVFEVSTFRREPSPEERKGRETDDGTIVWNDNVFGTLEDDARRRDFTVNALYFDPVSKSSEVIDFVGGLDDIDAKLVRTIGEPDRRIEEDPVRMLRACYLQGQYEFRPEPELESVICARADSLALASQARLMEELFKVLKKPFAHPVLQACHNYGLFDYFLPGMAGCWTTDSGEFCQDLLKARDRALLNGEIYPSRITGLVHLTLAFVETVVGDGDSDRLWKSRAGVEREVQDIILECLHPFNVPRRMTAIAREVMLLQPRMLYGEAHDRVVRHTAYPRARDVFKILIEAADMDPKLMDRWPEAKESRDREPRPARPRRSRKPRK